MFLLWQAGSSVGQSWMVKGMGGSSHLLGPIRQIRYVIAVEEPSLVVRIDHVIIAGIAEQ